MAAASGLARRLEPLVAEAAFEWGVVVFSAWVVGAAYFDAWTYVNNASGFSAMAPWQDAALHAGWFALTLWLLVAAYRRTASGLPWHRSLPVGYDASLAAALALGLLFALDRYDEQLWGQPRSLDNLLAPLRIAEMVAGTVMVTGPLRSAWRRGDPTLSLPAVLSAAMLLASLTFFTQFASPIRDPVSGLARPPDPIAWVITDAGAAAILVQSTLAAAFALLLVRGFRVRPGSFLLIFTIDALLMAFLKGYYQFVLVGLATGASADLAVIWFRPGSSRLSGVRVFAVVVAAVYAAAVLVLVAATLNLWWDSQLVAGVIVAAGVLGYLATHLVFPSARSQLARHRLESEGPSTRSRVDHDAVRAALESLDEPSKLAESPLVDLGLLTGSRTQRVVMLRELLIDSVRELAGSRDPREAEAGRVLLEYYVRRIGKHEVIAERLHLSRPTLFRRRDAGLTRLAETLDEMAEGPG